MFVLLAVVTLPASAHATFPGANGKIAFVRGGDMLSGGDIWTMDPDGTNQVNLTNSPATDESPSWSPDGNQIAFTSDRSGAKQIWVMRADGTGLRRVTDSSQPCCGTSPDIEPGWSPDGQEIAFSGHDRTAQGGDGLWLTNADGSGRTQIVASDNWIREPDWSPDGGKIAYIDYNPADDPGLMLVDPAGTSTAFVRRGPLSPSWSPDAQRIAYADNDLGGIWTIKPDGTDAQMLPGAEPTFSVAWPSLSPDGTKIAFFRVGEVTVMNLDSTGRVDLGPGREPAWQPIPINTYPRPKGATPMRISLVTANDQCTAPNRSHGAPLAFPSCAPFQLSSNRLTVGTGDSNGKDAFMLAFMRLDVVPGNPATVADEADVKLQAFVNDIFNKDLSDYTGGLRGELPVEITDKDNTPSPVAQGAATAQTFPFAFDFACTATADPSKGSDCALNTTFDALVPGAVKEQRRAIWALGQAKVYDGGTDGNPATTADNTLFAVQGVFVP